MLDIDEVIQRLTDEFGYPEKGASLVADKIVKLDTMLSSRFHGWWTEGIIEDVNIHGYSIERLQSEHGMNTIAAFLTLDWLLREPERATHSLRKGHDKIG